MLRVFTAFSGYDSQCLALNRIGIDYDLVGWSEIDKYAIIAHNALFPQYAERNYGDISCIDWESVPDFDLFTYSFPCTDISTAGQQKGLAESSGTRSSLLWECRKAIETKHPRFLVMENVKALVSKRFMPLFREWELYLDNLGYTNYSAVLNAKDYGVPQNRERVFMVSILGGEEKRYDFPPKEENNKCLRDVLEENVDKRHFLSKKVSDFYLHRTGPWARMFKITSKDKIARTVVASSSSSTATYIFEGPTENRVKQVANIVTSNGNFTNPQRGRVYDAGGIAPTLTTMQGGGREPKIVERSRHIRRLTPRECFRLMGLTETEIDTIQAVGISNHQQYKLAGNSIVVDVLAKIFANLLIKE